MSNNSLTSIPPDLREAIESFVEIAVDRRLEEILGDPDAGLEVNEELHRRLQQQRQRVANGDRGRSLNDLVRGTDS